MKKVLKSLIVFLCLAATPMIAQADEVLEELAKTREKVAKLKENQPKPSGNEAVDAYVESIYVCIDQSIELSTKVEELYLNAIAIAGNQDGAKGLVEKMPDIDELDDLQTEIVDHASLLTAIATTALPATNAAKSQKNPIKIARDLKNIYVGGKAYGQLVASSAQQVATIAGIIKSAASGYKDGVEVEKTQEKEKKSKKKESKKSEESSEVDLPSDETSESEK